MFCMAGNEGLRCFCVEFLLVWFQLFTVADNLMVSKRSFVRHIIILLKQETYFVIHTFICKVWKLSQHRDANLQKSKSGRSPLKDVKSSAPPKMPKICQSKCEKCTLGTSLLIQEIWLPAWETGRFSLYPGDSQIIQEIWHLDA